MCGSKWSGKQLFTPFSWNILHVGETFVPQRQWLPWQVDPRHFHILGNWQSKYTIETILVELRREMAGHHNRKLPQPPEGTTY